MKMPSSDWIKWAETLSHFHIKGLVGWLLEAGDPFTLLGAQLLYFGQPFTENKNVTNLAAFLENKEETRAFAAFLRKE